MNAQAHRWITRIAAILLGLGAAATVPLYVSQLASFSGFSFLPLLGLFALICSLAGVIGAIWLWRFQPLGWWISAWFCLFTVFSALAPLVIFGQLPDLDPLQGSWLFVVCAALVYLLTPSARAAHRISSRWPTASVKILAAALLCVSIQFGYSAYFVARATWFSD